MGLHVEPCTGEHVQAISVVSVVAVSPVVEVVAVKPVVEVVAGLPEVEVVPPAIVALALEPSSEFRDSSPVSVLAPVLDPAAEAPPSKALTGDELPACAHRAGVTDAERDELRRLFQRHPEGLTAAGGMLALGLARMVAAVPQKDRDGERERLTQGFGESLAFRRHVGAEGVLDRGLPAALMGGAQSESWEYGKTRAGLPIFVDRAVTWRRAIAIAREQGLTPAEYGAQRVFWHERCLQVSAKHHAAGVGNGQYIHVIDFDGVDIGMGEVRAMWPYLKEATVTVALHYGGCCARIYVARAPRLFSWAWRLLRPFLTEATNAKVGVVAPRSAPPRVEHFDFSPATAMAADSLPSFLGGVLELPCGPMHYCAPLDSHTDT